MQEHGMDGSNYGILLPRKYYGSKNRIFRNHDCVSPGFSPDGRFLACYDGKNGGLIFVVDAVRAKVIDRIPVASLNLVSLAVDVNGCGLAIATTRGRHIRT